jgi:hypothetical protein
MCETTLPARETAAAARGRASRPVVPGAPAPAAAAPASGRDPIAVLEACLGRQQGLWSSRRVRAAIVEAHAAEHCC